MVEQRRVRVAFLASCVRGGGAGWSLYYLIKHLDRSRIEPLIILPDRGIFGERYDALGVEILVPRVFPETRTALRFRRNTQFTQQLSGALNIADQFRMIPALVKTLRERRVDLLYCNNMRMHEIGAPAAQIAGIPCVLHARNLYDSSVRNWMYRQIAKLPAVRSVIANSIATAEPYRGLAKLRVIHNGIDTSEYRAEDVPIGHFRRELGITEDTPLIGFTGRIEPKKGLEVLIRAAKRLLDSHPEVVFAIVGEVPNSSPIDYRSEYETLSRSLGVSDRIVFAGFRRDIRPAVVDFDIVALPSFREPFGRTIIEGMALGRPVVSCASGGVLEIVTDGHDGLLVPPGDVTALANALIRLIENPDERNTLGMAAATTARERFDVAVLSRQIQKIILEAIVSE